MNRRRAALIALACIVFFDVPSSTGVAKVPADTADTPLSVEIRQTEFPPEQWEGFYRQDGIDMRFGFRDPEGKVVIDAQFLTAGKFECGVVPVENESGWWIMDSSGKALNDTPFDDMGPFFDCIAYVGRAENGEMKYGYIDNTGDMITQMMFSQRPQNFSHGYGLTWHGKQSVFINSEGQSAAVFPRAINFVEGLAGVKPDGDIDKWGYVDVDFDLVIPADFDSIYNFSEGMAAVELDHKVGYINKEGEIIIEPIFDVGFTFKNGYAAVENDGQWYLIDIEGNRATIAYQEDDFFKDVSAAKGDRFGTLLRDPESWRVYQEAIRGQHGR